MTQLSTVSHCAFVRTRPGYSAELGTRLNELVEPTRLAPGCLHFVLQRSQRDEDLWWLSGSWIGQAAMNSYFESPVMQVFSDPVQQLLVRSLDLHTFDEMGASAIAAVDGRSV